jgi:hypothetical protein
MMANYGTNKHHSHSHASPDVTGTCACAGTLGGSGCAAFWQQQAVARLFALEAVKLQVLQRRDLSTGAHFVCVCTYICMYVYKYSTATCACASIRQDKGLRSQLNPTRLSPVMYTQKNTMHAYGTESTRCMRMAQDCTH